MLTASDRSLRSAYDFIILAIAPLAASWAAPFLKFCHSHPFVIAAYRMTFASALLLPFYLARFQRSQFPQRRELLKLAVAGFFLAAHFAVWITGLRYTSVASATVLVTIQPLFLTVLAHFVLGEHVDRWGYLAVIVALSGAGAISWGDFQLSGQHVIGDLLSLSGALFAAFYLLVGRQLVGKLGLVNYVFPVYTVSAVVLWITSIVAGADLRPQQDTEFLWFFLLALVPTMFGHTFYNYSLKHFRAHLVGITTLVEPILASIWALLLFEESPTLMTVFGSLLIFIAIFFSFRREMT